MPRLAEDWVTSRKSEVPYFLKEQPSADLCIVLTLTSGDLSLEILIGDLSLEILIGVK